MPATNLHATAIVLGDRCVLVTGPSGSGKTTLALSLIARWSGDGRYARLVSDDQVFLSARHGRLVCRQASTIAGLAEIVPLGPREVAAAPAAVVDLVVALRPAAEIARLTEIGEVELAGVAVPSVGLSMRSASASVVAVASLLGEAPFRANGAVRRR